MMGPRPGMMNGAHGTTPSPLRSPYNTTSSPTQAPFGGMQHHPGMANPYRFGTPQQQGIGHHQPHLNPMMQQGMTAGNSMQQQQQMMGMGGYSNGYYNQGMNNQFSMQQQQQQQQQQYPQGNFPGASTNMTMGGAYGANQPYRYGMQQGYGNGNYGQYGMMPGNAAPTSGPYPDQFNQYSNGQQGYGNNGMYGGGMPGYNNQQRMIGNEPGMMGQPVPPHFRQQQQQMMVPGGGPSPLMGNMSMMGNNPPSIGQPRISPSAMHKPMPGVGLVSPSLGPSQANRLQTTPLVSPQSMHSVSEQSPMHNQPLTPVNSYGGPTTPQSCNPMTPMGMGMQSPMTPHGQNQMHQPVHQNHLGYQHQNMMSPMPQEDVSMRSPMSSSASNLRKIRRPSKSSYRDDNMLSPKADFRDDDSGRLADFGDLMKDEDDDLEDQIKTEMEMKFEPTDVTPQHHQLQQLTPQPPTPVQHLLSPPPQTPHQTKKSLIKEEVKEEKPVIKPESPKPEPVKIEEPEPEKEEPKYEARWSELDEKILKRIFSFCVVNDGAVPFLVRASRVSSAWHKASQDIKLWTHLDLSQGRLKEKYRNDKKLEWFLKKYPNVLEVKLGGWKNSVSTSTLRLVANHCPNLVSFGLSGCLKLTNEDLKIVGDSFPKLERLDLSGVSVSLSFHFTKQLCNA